MNVEIKEVSTNSELNKFIRFPYSLYKNNKYWVPTLDIDDRSTLNKRKNPAFDFCEARYWMAYIDGEIVGRIAGIINHQANKHWNERKVRFGWIDFVNDIEVAAALLQTVETWANKNGCTEIHGPLGFTDLDREGMLVFGFDVVATYATNYNYEYYPEILEKLGYSKDVDWIQFELIIPNEKPDKLEKIAALIAKRYNVHSLKATKTKQLLKYGPQVFDVLNQSYSQLYGFSPLTEKQIKIFTKQYIGFIKPEFVSIILNDKDEVVAFGITMPSLSVGVQKSKGKLLPFGWWHILKATKNSEVLDMYLIAVRPDMQNKGINALIFDDLMTNYIKNGVKKTIINPVLEINRKMMMIWEDYNPSEPIMRRRCFIKKIE